MKVIENPYIDIIGHSGSPAYRYDYEAVILKAKENRKLLEINEHSFSVRKSSVPNCKAIALLCKKHGVPIAVNSDAHFITDLGNYSNALAMLKEIDFPEELIINTSYEKIKQYLAPRKII